VITQNEIRLTGCAGQEKQTRHEIPCVVKKKRNRIRLPRSFLPTRQLAAAAGHVGFYSLDTLS
jgi:hypothetical protein